MTAALARASVQLGANLVLAYRLEVFVQLVSASIVMLLNWSLWTAIFQGRTLVAGRTAPELTTYVVVAWLVTTFYATRVDQVLALRFREGLIAVDLARPWDLHFHHYFRDLGRAMVVLVLTTLPLALWTGLLLPLRMPRDPWTWFAAGVSLLLAQGIAFGIAWLVGVASFRLKNAAGLSRLKSSMIAVFSGALIPLDLYPTPLRQIVLLLPFQGMSHVPADIFVERYARAELWIPLGTQVFWVIALLVLGRWAFRAACRSIVIQGG